MVGVGGSTIDGQKHSFILLIHLLESKKNKIQFRVLVVVFLNSRKVTIN